jgi:lipocalin
MVNNKRTQLTMRLLRITWRRKLIQFPKRRVFCFLEYRTMEKVQKPNNSVYCTPSSENLWIYNKTVVEEYILLGSIV